MGYRALICKPYPIINLTFAGMILVILVYSGIFSATKDNHPVPSFYEKITGSPSPGSGLSRSFSEIVRLRFDSALEFNPYGIRVFLFFYIQLFLRGLFTWLYLTNRIRTGRLVTTDAVLSAGLFVVCFRDFIRFWITSLWSVI